MQSKRLCFRMVQRMASGALFPCRMVSQFRRPEGFGGRLATRIMNFMNRAQYKQVLKELPLQGRILDIGFGNGKMLQRVLNKGCRSVYGTEISNSCMTAVEGKLLPSLQKGYLKLAMGRAESLPYADAYMDTVYSINTIYFWKTLDMGLHEIARILRPGGTLLLAFYEPSFMSRLPLNEYGFQLYEPMDVKAALKRNGYTSIEIHVVKKKKSYCIRAKRGDARERGK